MKVKSKDLTPFLRLAPGWAYLPVAGSAAINFKIPDGVTNTGAILKILRNGTVSEMVPPISGGNDAIPFAGLHGNGYSIKHSDGRWEMITKDTRGSWSVELPAPNDIFGGLECHPFLADFDGDDIVDRAVQCPTEFRIALSSNGEVLHVPLGYNTNDFSLPGKPYFGSVSYQVTQRLIQWQKDSSSSPAVIPVDMVSSAICSLSWNSNERPAECKGSHGD